MKRNANTYSFSGFLVAPEEDTALKLSSVQTRSYVLWILKNRKTLQLRSCKESLQRYTNNLYILHCSNFQFYIMSFASQKGKIRNW